jgi:hypothetical protein
MTSLLSLAQFLHAALAIFIKILYSLPELDKPDL